MPSSQSKRGASRHFDSLPQEAFLNLWRTYDRLRDFEDALFSRFDLTPQQYNVLRLLRGEHPTPQPTLSLAARLVSHAPDITRMLDKLAARELVTRERPADNRRVVLVSLTPTGIALLREIDKPLRQCHHEQLGHLPPADLEQLIKLLKAARAPHEEDRSIWK
ncbi:MAG TPA: MarR family transcriptional regulator [Pirellulaceae bacterium]|nr:MarR family transcriptional regulator [Pirellulaceae bacterium]